MSDFVGAVVYRIEMSANRDARVSLGGGARADGTKIQIW